MATTEHMTEHGINQDTSGYDQPEWFRDKNWKERYHYLYWRFTPDPMPTPESPDRKPVPIPKDQHIEHNMFFEGWRYCPWCRLMVPPELRRRRKRICKTCWNEHWIGYRRYKRVQRYCARLIMGKSHRDRETLARRAIYALGGYDGLAEKILEHLNPKNRWVNAVSFQRFLAAVLICARDAWAIQTEDERLKMLDIREISKWTEDQIGDFLRVALINSANRYRYWIKSRLEELGWKVTLPEDCKPKAET